MRPLDQVMLEMKGCAVSGGLVDAPIEKLKEYAAALCHSGAYTHLGAQEFPQVAETVRINLLRAHIELLQGHVVKLQGHFVELHSHITSLDAKNSTLQKWVAALAVAALVAGTAQAVTAILPYVGIFPSQPTATTLQTPAPEQLVPSQSAPSKPDQPAAKKLSR